MELAGDEEGHSWAQLSGIAYISTVTIVGAALYLLWKHHPSYGANPGLPSFPLFGSIPLILLNKHRFYDWTCEVFERANVLTCRSFIGPALTIIATADPQNVQHVLKTNFDSYPKGPNFYPYFHDVFGSGIFNSDGPLWRFQRKVASHVFTSNSVKDFVVDIADTEICCRLLPALSLSSEDQSGLPIDLQALFMDFTFDTISQLTFGADPACLKGCKFVKSKVNEDVQHDLDAKMQVEHLDAKTHVERAQADDAEHGARIRPSYMKVPDDLIQGFVEGFPIALQVTADRFLTPKFIWQTKRMLKIGSEKKLMDAMAALNKFASFVIQQSKSTCHERNDLLARFMRLSKPQVESLLEGEDEAAWKSETDDEHGQALSDSLLKNILLSFVLAGRETVASGITYMMWQLCCHPMVEKVVYDEVQGIIKERESTTQEQKLGTFTFEELRKMNYLHAALSESMRLYPPIPSNPKYAAQDDVLPDGTRVQKGNEVSYNVLAMGRSGKLWGNDALEFKPERWLGEDGQFVPVSPYVYPVFQAGLRTCLGKDFAFIQIKLVVASLVCDFAFKLAPGFSPKASFGINMSMANGLPVTVTRRRKPDACM